MDLRKLLLAAGFLTFLSGYSQQSFTGLRNGYYSGVVNSLSNPAYLSGSARSWDVNLFSGDANVSFDKIGLNFSDMNKSIREFSDTNNYRNLSGSIYSEVMGPSFMFKIGSKDAVGFVSRVRFFGNVENLDAKFFEVLTSKPQEMTKGTIEIDLNNQKAVVNAFSDFGLSWSRKVFENENNVVRVGASVKYVRGVLNTRVYINNLKGSIKVDERTATLNGSGSMEVINSGVSFTDFNGSDLLKSNASGVGFDLGAVYEFRESPDQKYKVRASFAITDIGKLKYTPVKDESYKYTLNNASVEIIDNFEEDLRKAVSTAINKVDVLGDYSASLPTAVQLAVDYNIYKNIYVDASSMLSVSKSDNKPQNSYYLNSISLTPRFENRYFGVYLPMTYGELSKFSTGLALRMGPLYLGSSSLFNNLGSSSKNINLFFGLRFGR